MIYNFSALITKEKFYNYDSFYGIYAFTTISDIPINKKYLTSLNDFTKGNETVEGILVGKMQHLEEKLTYMITAELVKHKTYGDQYLIHRASIIKPSNLDESFTLLQAFCTVNQSKKILDSYPDFIKNVIDGETNFSVDGIQFKRLKAIIKGVSEGYIMSDIISLLTPLGVSYNMISKITEDIKDPVLLKQTLYQNPYILTRINGLGFKKVDKIALSVNPELRGSKKRSDAFINFFLKSESQSNGNTLVPKSNIIAGADFELLGFDNFYENKTLIGLNHFYRDESEIYVRLLKMIKINTIEPDKDTVLETEEKLGIKYTEEQKNALKVTTKSDFSIIAGAAGTGKSTVIRGIIEMFNTKDIALCALSAKAAQRMIELTGHTAYTIHKLLVWDGDQFEYGSENKLPFDIVILDEASMVNIYMFRSLLRAIKNKFIIVFDHAQLPPIGAGNIASDLLKSDKFPKGILTKIHRQAARSGIIVHATEVRNSRNPNQGGQSLTYGELNDMHYRFLNRESIKANLISAYKSAIEKFDKENVIIILPRRTTVELSTEKMNEILHNEFFDEYIPSLKYGKKVYCLGEKIIQRKNNYNKNVFNGEIGFITNISIDEYTVKFLDRSITFERKDLKDMDYAYAITVHSFQGSQSPIVLIGIDWTHYILLDNCLLYTAITRASKHCMIFAERKAFNFAISKSKGKERITFLNKIINGSIEPYQRT